MTEKLKAEIHAIDAVKTTPVLRARTRLTDRIGASARTREEIRRVVTGHAFDLFQIAAEGGNRYQAEIDLRERLELFVATLPSDERSEFRMVYAEEKAVAKKWAKTQTAIGWREAQRPSHDVPVLVLPALDGVVRQTQTQVPRVPGDWIMGLRAVLIVFGLVCIGGVLLMPS